MMLGGLFQQHTDDGRPYYYKLMMLGGLLKQYTDDGRPNNYNIMMFGVLFNNILMLGGRITTT